MRKNWRVRYYDNKNRIVESWVIKDRTEHEAENEAWGDVNSQKRNIAE
jgi:hypothetical protein